MKANFILSKAQKFTNHLLLFLLANFSIISFAEFNYTKIEENSHIIHLLTIPMTEYESSLISAHNQVFGRETVEDIARRENADIAINSGFFEIGNNQDGRPTGTLISNGEIYGLRNTRHGCFIKKDNKHSVELITPKLFISINGHEHEVSQFNRFARGSRFFYFNRNWGISTLSSFDDRQEIAIDENNNVVEISKHGNIKIPNQGSVISFPKSFNIKDIKLGNKINLRWIPEYIIKKNNFLVMGLPVLIINGKIRENLSDKNINSRTAIGIKNDGTIIIVVAEHTSKKNISDISSLDLREILKDKNFSPKNTSLRDLKKILHSDIEKVGNIKGLTLKELAEFMHKQNCISAINLDGGGSSSLYINGKYVNKSARDNSEPSKHITFRPVSDAIIFKKIQ